MNFLKSKQNLETYSVEDIDVLERYNGIKVLNRDDRLWLLAIAILSNSHYVQRSIDNYLLIKLVNS
jgi:hypothetical protein